MSNVNIPNVSTGQIKTVVYIVVAIVVIVLIIYIATNVGGGIGKVFEKIGLKDSELDRLIAQEKAKASTEDYFSPSYYRNPPKGKKSAIVQPQIIDGIVNEIWTADKTFSTNAEQIQGAFEQLKNKCQVSELAYYFNKASGKSLYANITNLLDGKPELFNILHRTNNLPTGYF